MKKTGDHIPRGIVVSCQAREGHPLHGPMFMAAMACAAELGGAVAIRAEGAADVKAVKSATKLPVIGLRKRRYSGSAVYITPTFRDAADIATAGADIIAVDGTARRRPDGESLTDLVSRVHGEFGLPVLADVDSRAAADFAVEAGVDLFATTLSGYTDSGLRPGPDIDLVAELVRGQNLPVLAEGRFRLPSSAAAAFAAGAHAVVVGTSITDPVELTRRFVAAVDAPDPAPHISPHPPDRSMS